MSFFFVAASALRIFLVDLFVRRTFNESRPLFTAIPPGFLFPISGRIDWWSGFSFLGSRPLVLALCIDALSGGCWYALSPIPLGASVSTFLLFRYRPLSFSQLGSFSTRRRTLCTLLLLFYLTFFLLAVMDALYHSCFGSTPFICGLPMPHGAY